MKFTREQIIELIDGAETERVEPWRHGHKEYLIVPFEGKHYRICVAMHSDEGPQIFGPTEGVEVEKVEVAKAEWRAVNVAKEVA